MGVAAHVFQESEGANRQLAASSIYFRRLVGVTSRLIQLNCNARSPRTTPCAGMNQGLEALPPILEGKPVVMVWSPVMMEAPTRELRCAMKVV